VLFQEAPQPFVGIPSSKDKKPESHQGWKIESQVDFGISVKSGRREKPGKKVSRRAACGLVEWNQEMIWMLWASSRATSCKTDSWSRIGRRFCRGERLLLKKDGSEC
jgi:hypothetical protein